MGWDDSDEDDWESPSSAYGQQQQPKKWSDEEDVEDEAPKEVSAKSLPPTEGSGKKKRSLKQILKEREEKEAARRAEIAALEQDDDDDDELTKEEKRAREREQILEADLRNAEDLFSESTIDDKTKGRDDEDALYSKPTGPKEFKLYGDALVKHLIGLQKVKGFTVFLERVLRDVASELSIDDINSFSSVLKVLANSKQQEQRKKDGKKKSKKPSLQAAQSKVDDGTSYDDYDMFM